MKKYLLIIAMFIPCLTFAANDVEVTGWFVVAPIASADCEAAATTMPTYGLDEDSELLTCLTYMFTDSEGDADGIEDVNVKTSEEKQISSIFSIDGQKKSQLTNGVNIVVYDNGESEKVLVNQDK